MQNQHHSHAGSNAVRASSPRPFLYGAGRSGAQRGGLGRLPSGPSVAVRSLPNRKLWLCQWGPFTDSHLCSNRGSLVGQLQRNMLLFSSSKYLGHPLSGQSILCEVSSCGQKKKTKSKEQTTLKLPLTQELHMSSLRFLPLW